MVKSLAELMKDRFQQPPEIKAIKNYIKRHYDEEVTVALASQQIKIHVPNSALAAVLRMEIENLKQAAKTDKKLVILIG